MAAKDVSCKLLAVFFWSLKENKLPVEILSKGIPYDAGYLKNQKNSIEWDALCQIFANLREIWSDDEYFETLGIQFVQHRVYPVITMISQLIFSIKDVYSMINDPKKGIGHNAVKCITPSTREIEEGHIEVKLELLDGYQSCRDFFLVTKGFFIAAPTMLKLKPATVIMKETSRGAVYNISYPISKRTFSWIRGIFSLTTSKHTAIEELNNAYELLYDRFYELEENKAKIQFQAKQLQTAHNFSQLIRGDLNLDDALQTIAKSLIDLEDFDGVELTIDEAIAGEKFRVTMKPNNDLNEQFQIVRKLQARGKDIGNIKIWLKEKTNPEDAQQLLDYIIPSISMEIMNAISFKLLNDYRDELENKVDERTQQLKNANEELNVSLDKLKELKNARDKFFASISHEFRTPLTLILGPSENLILNSTEIETKRKAGLIKKNADRMLVLVNQLLDLSRLDYGKFEIKASKRNIIDFVRGVAFSFESLAERKDILIKFFSKDELIELYFDNEVMMKILTNLLSNAFKFTEVGGVISINIYKTDFNSVLIKIKDTGIGIPESELPKLFDRFFQVDQSSSRKYEGSGLGLALTKELIELHHGKISVKSKKEEQGVSGSGWTEFTIEFPLGKSHLKDEEIVDEQLLQNQQAQNYEIDRRIFATAEISENQMIDPDKDIVLIVEDNEDLRQMIKESLKKTYTIIEAENGVKGLKLAEENIPDLIISDIMMPEMDGYELTQKIKADEKTNHIPIILLTAKASIEDKLEGLETGADDYLIKPFSEKELTVRVKNLIKTRQQMREKYLSQSLVKPGDVVVPSSQKVFIEKLISIINKNISNEKFSVEVLCKEIGMSRTQLHRKIKSVTNQSTTEFIRNYKLQLAAELLKQDAGNIAEISNKVGFGSQAYFTKLFQELYGMTPLEYRKQSGK